MSLRVLETFTLHLLVYVVAFEDLIYVYGEGNKEMLEQGRAQYRLIRDRVGLPKYGSCWKSAIKHLDEGCRHLSEDTQSDMALHITNCFLEMSGHETYNCELDKKPNLRSICISSMSDRAFNVYTEFYTHTQNICWFLRGQIWHETIAENTWKVGKQLELSAETQESLLRAQRNSLELQEKMMKHGQFLEKVLEDLYISTRAHQEILQVLSQSVTNLQAWIVGEISWIDSIIFYTLILFLILIVTSSHRTLSSRLILFLLVFFNFVIERSICSFLVAFSTDFNTENLYSNIYKVVWYSRYAFCCLGAVILIYKAFIFRDVGEQNNDLLCKIQKQNNTILDILEKMRGSTISYFKTAIEDTSQVKILNETSEKLTHIDSSFSFKENSYNKNSSRSLENNSYNNNSNGISMSYREKSISPKIASEVVPNIKNNNFRNGTAKSYLSSLSELNSRKYNLRSRTGTPDSGVND